MVDYANTPPEEKNLSESESRKYKSICRDVISNGGVINELNRYAIAEAAELMEMIKLAKNDIKRMGIVMTVSGDKGSELTKTNPAITVIDKSRSQLIKIYEKLGILSVKSAGAEIDDKAILQL